MAVLENVGIKSGKAWEYGY